MVITRNNCTLMQDMNGGGLSMKATNLIVVMIFALILSATAVFAADIEDLKILTIDIGDYNNAQDLLDDNARALVFDRGEKIPIDVKVTNDAVVPEGEDPDDYTLEDVEIEAKIFGYRYNQVQGELISDSTRPFDLRVGEVESERLNLEVPVLHPTDDVKLRIIVGTANGVIREYNYQLKIEGVAEDEAVQIKDFILNPDPVVAGRAFTSIVKVKNIGDYSLDDLKVTVSVPALGIRDSEFMQDELDPDDTASFEELLLRVPMDAEPGTYDVDITVDFDEFESVTETGEIQVVAEKGTTPSTEARTVISVPSNQELAAGTTVVYPIKISNMGSDSKTYALSVSGVSEWGTYKFEPSGVVVVNGESSKTVLLSIAAGEDAAVGAKSFTVNIESDGESKDVSLTASITEGAETAQWDQVKRGLEIALVVLVIILIIIGLIIGFSKLRDSGRKDEEAQTYY